MNLSRLPDAPLNRLPWLLAGALLYALAFAPGPLPAWLLPCAQWLGLGLLARHTLLAPTPWRAARDAWLFGTVFFALGTYWIYISLHTFGGIPAPLAVAAVVALAAVMALYFGLAALLTRWLAPDGLGLPAILAWSAAWTGAEWLRGTLFTGFPWLNAAYAQVDGPYAGWAILGGAYTVAFWAAFSSAALLVCLPAGTLALRRRWPALGLALVTAAAGPLLARVEWSHADGEPLRVALVQGNIGQDIKFDPIHIVNALQTHLQMSAAALESEQGADLVLLPETMIPLFQHQLPMAFWEQWRDLAANHEAVVLMGVPLYSGPPDRYTNSIVSLHAETDLDALFAGTPAEHYDKQHLVPFGEFIPAGFRWFVDMMEMPLGDFNRGDISQPPFPAHGQSVAANICYEDVFGEELLPAVRNGATLLANFSNLGWFGSSWALRQHLQMSRLRAQETARPMLRATNTGATAIVDERGQVQHSLPTASVGTLYATVQGRSGLTPYARTGNTPVLAVIALLLVLLGAARLRRKPDAASR
ncbi:apolipoprotein N-acyltransferase [Kerstersia sp.]|uniref:apolipoprotein N-acyltransferase n=1 Tax=Kerstersia sp. TaxID=1930783 RepID=UPI003F93546F